MPNIKYRYSITYNDTIQNHTFGLSTDPETFDVFINGAMVYRKVRQKIKSHSFEFPIRKLILDEDDVENIEAINDQYVFMSIPIQSSCGFKSEASGEPELDVNWIQSLEYIEPRLTIIELATGRKLLYYHT